MMLIKPMLRLVAIILLSIMSAQHSLASEGLLSEYVWMVKTSGTWKADGRFGYYRVVVSRKPGEAHNFDEVQVQLLEQMKDGHRKVVKSILLDTPGYEGYVDDINFNNNVAGGKIAISIDVLMNAMDGITLRSVYLLSPDGTVKPLVKATYKDIYEAD